VAVTYRRPQPLPVDLADGLYAVVELLAVSAFVVEAGRVVDCAPYIRDRLRVIVAHPERYRIHGPVAQPTATV
jgi:hypothetical protein